MLNKEGTQFLRRIHSVKETKADLSLDALIFHPHQYRDRTYLSESLNEIRSEIINLY